MPLFRRQTRKAQIIICAVCTLLVAFEYLAEKGELFSSRSPLRYVDMLLTPLRKLKPLQSGEFYSEDAIASFLGRKAKIDDQLVYLTIDHQAINLSQFNDDEINASPALTLMKEGWPWSRKVYPLIYEKLFNAGAKVVALDLMFPTVRDGDDDFRAGLDKFRDGTVIGSNFVNNEIEGHPVGAYQTPDSLITLISPMDSRVGFVNYWPDADGVIRNVNYHIAASEVFGYAASPDEEIYDSFDTAVLKKSGHADMAPSTSAPHRIRFAGKGHTFDAHSISDIFFPNNWKYRYNDGAFFRGKIVIIGPDGDFLKDLVRTPTDDLMPGPELHLNAINAALSGDFLRELPPWTNYLLICLSGLAGWLVSIRVQKPLLRLVILAIAGAAWFGIVQLLYNYAGTVVLTLVPIVGLELSGVCCLSWDFFLEQREKARVRGKFERYVSKQVVQEIVDNPESFFNTLGGVRKPVAVFFSDLRGFTSMTEQAENEHALVTQLNEYFDVMVTPIHDNNGCLDKLIGDAIMAVWGNIQSRGPAEDVRDAIRTALKMRELLPELNQRWAAEGKKPYTMGMGINFGEVIVGDLGSKQQKNFTVIGDAVNLGSRIEGTTKEYGVDLLVGEDAAKLVQDYFLMQTGGLTRVKGRTKPVELFYIIGERPAVIEPRQEEYMRIYGEGMALYIKGEFVAAGEKFKRSLELHPPDALAKVYIERCAEMAKGPVPEGWDGVFVMKGK